MKTEGGHSVWLRFLLGRRGLVRRYYPLGTVGFIIFNNVANVL